MKSTAKFVVAGILVAALASPALAAESAKKKDARDWDKVEESAMRPYKYMLRGVGALLVQTNNGLRDGNEKLPVFGSVEIFRGLRRGSVELMRSTVMGMAGARPAPVENLGRANHIIDEDLFLRNAADFAAGALVIGATGTDGEGALMGGAKIWAGEKITDRSPFRSEEDNLEKASKRESRADIAVRSLASKHAQRKLEAKEGPAKQRLASVR